MISDLVSEGCGATREQYFMCLQEHPNPLLRVCCKWHPSCGAKKESYRQQILAGKAPAEAYESVYKVIAPSFLQAGDTPRLLQKDISSYTFH